jgi:hypothetical protein
MLTYWFSRFFRKTASGVADRRLSLFARCASRALARSFALIVVVASLLSVGKGADGGLDGSFNPGGSGADSEVYTVAAQPD